MLVLVDDRVSDAFSGEDVALLESLTLQIGVVVENSRQYRRLQERDRLAALGQMAAGLAHEVKNPLGAIKGAAQLLGEPSDGRELDATTKEFIGIILEEVDRLDRVVRSVLDYGRPSKGNPGSVDVNAAVRRTLQVLGSSRDQATRRILQTAEDLPPVRVDEEQLRQVVINLVNNAEEGDGRRRARSPSRPADARRPTGVGLRGDRHPGPRARRAARGPPGTPFRTVLHHEAAGHGPRFGHQPAHGPGHGRPHRGLVSTRGSGPPSVSFCRPSKVAPPRSHRRLTEQSAQSGGQTSSAAGANGARSDGLNTSKASSLTVS